MAACFVCVCGGGGWGRVSVCQTFSTGFLCRSYLFNAKTDQVHHMWCAYAPCSKGNVMWVGMLGSNFIKGVLLNETLR